MRFRRSPGRPPRTHSLPVSSRHDRLDSTLSGIPRRPLSLSGRDGGREPPSAASTRHPPAVEARPSSPYFVGPSPLGLRPAALPRMAAEAGHHQARDRDRVASPGVSTLLEEEVAGWATESACHSGEHELWSLGAIAPGNSHCALTQSDISAVLDAGLIDEEPWRVFRPGAESCPDQLVEEEWSFPKKNPRTKGNILPLSFWPAYFLGLQPGWLHAQGFLPSAQEVEQYFFPFTSTVASLQEQAPLLHPAFASFSIAAISTSMRRSVSRIYSHGACHGGGSAIVNAL